jgi:propionyl-CoA carboxylase alpha chain
VRMFSIFIASITAAQDVTVAEVLAAKGESLAVDQPILRFA